MPRCLGITALLSGLLVTTVSAEPIKRMDFGKLDLGAKIVGPVGPGVEVSLINSDETSVGDLRSSVNCPSGLTKCFPSKNPAGSVYTYSHTVTPGRDKPNDPPFPQPENVLGFDDVNGFGLDFEAAGFNGVAGYDFAEADAAGVSFSIERTESGRLVWATDSDDWDTGEPITFFWQTTHAPVGPTGVYTIWNGTGRGAGKGPVPAAR